MARNLAGVVASFNSDLASAAVPALTDGIIPATRSSGEPFLIGALPGEGSGPEVVAAALRVLDALSHRTGLRFDIRFGGPIGLESSALSGRALSSDVIAFCGAIFDSGGAVLAGAGGGRFVYEARREFGLFCKLNPITMFAELSGDSLDPVDVVVVRENLAGLYHGDAVESRAPNGDRSLRYTFGYSESEIRAILRVGAKLAARRRGEMGVVAKASGLPELTALWAECAAAAAAEARVVCQVLDVDYAAYRLLREPTALDVLVTPNCFGDILSDLGGILMGSRGVTYGASFSAEGWGVYQTNHGAAFDLAGTDRVNPVGQILSVAMLLRESFGLWREAGWIEAAVRTAWRDGWRTDDIRTPGCRRAGTREMTEVIAELVAQRAAEPVAA